jgi:hypothetical protein
MARLHWAAIASAAILASCVPAKVSTIGNLAPLPHPVSRLALAPSGGILADAVGIALLGDGFDIVDTQQTSTWMLRANLDEFELMKPENLGRLGEQGIDALVVLRTVAGYDNKPQSATVRIVSTKTSSLVAGLSWQNGRGGAQGSGADADMRKDVVDAAAQISKELVRQLRR